MLLFQGRAFARVSRRHYTEVKQQEKPLTLALKFCCCPGAIRALSYWDSYKEVALLTAIVDFITIWMLSFRPPSICDVRVSWYIRSIAAWSLNNKFKSKRNLISQLIISSSEQECRCSSSENCAVRQYTMFQSGRRLSSASSPHSFRRFKHPKAHP